MTTRALLRVAIATCALAGVALAQKPVAKPVGKPMKAAKCLPVDSTAEWYRAQRAWMDDSKGGWSDDAFRTALLQSAGIHGSAEVPVLWGGDVKGEAPAAAGDSVLIARLRGLASQRGSTWPTRSVVGGAGTYAVWLLALRDSAIAPAVLKRMMEAGPDESPPAAVATLEDRLRLARGRKQLYATRLQRLPNGLLEPLPTEDLAHVDLRREGAHLPPLKVSFCSVRK